MYKIRILLPLKYFVNSTLINYVLELLLYDIVKNWINMIHDGKRSISQYIHSHNINILQRK